MPIQDEPAAHALFDQMLAAMKNAETLSFVSHYTWQVEDSVLGDFTYRVSLKKPNYFRVEVGLQKTGDVSGILIGDGDIAWLHWPHGRPQWESIPEDPTAYQQTHLTSFTKVSAPAGSYSIGHALSYAARDTVMPIINPSIFHGYIPSLHEYIDGVKSLGTERVGDELCDKIEVSIMGCQRGWFLWLSQRDHLPRRLKQIVRVTVDHVMDEEWSAVEVNHDIPDSQFQWSPPPGWTEWVKPKPEELLLPAGTKAPDFDLAGADGSRIKISDFEGQVVWLYIWRVGCPPCREGMPALQNFFAQYKDQGLVVIGLNDSDEKDMALNFLTERGVTFPNILDTSDKALEVTGKHYRCFGVPVSYIIGRDGKVVDAWLGHSEGHTRELASLRSAGLKLNKP